MRACLRPPRIRGRSAKGLVSLGFKNLAVRPPKRDHTSHTACNIVTHASHTTHAQYLLAELIDKYPLYFVWRARFAIAGLGVNEKKLRNSAGNKSTSYKTDRRIY